MKQTGQDRRSFVDPSNQAVCLETHNESVSPQLRLYCQGVCDVSQIVVTGVTVIGCESKVVVAVGTLLEKAVELQVAQGCFFKPASRVFFMPASRILLGSTP